MHAGHRDGAGPPASLHSPRWQAAACWSIAFDLAARAHPATGEPNVILLGIDSLRLDELQRFGGKPGNTPHIDEFLEEADLVRDASTPMPRTFGSWVAILTGRSPP